MTTQGRSAVLEYRDTWYIMRRLPLFSWKDNDSQLTKLFCLNTMKRPMSCQVDNPPEELLGYCDHGCEEGMQGCQWIYLCATRTVTPLNPTTSRLLLC
jgi:hypothetical protein